MEGNIYMAAFKETLEKFGFNIQDEKNDILRLNLNGDHSKTLTAQLIVSEPIDESIHGSHNGNEIQAIGYFKFRLPPPGVSEQDFFIFGFQNQPNDRVEFIIIQTDKFIRRLQSKNRTKKEDQVIELQFWLMEDNYVFETNGISAEGEWWFINGRMAEQTEWDYSKFLNNWEILSWI
jgi:hypothetical protein